MENKENKERMEESRECKDPLCPVHGALRVRGRTFRGAVEKVVGTRAVIIFERFIYYPKYQRYARCSTKLHAHIPACIAAQIRPGIKVNIGECRPISKITHYVITGVEK